MKIALSTLAATALLSLLFYWLMPEPQIPEQIKAEQLPWNIKLDVDGRISVLGLTLGQSTLADAFKLYGEPETLAIFDGPERDSLEAYYSSIMANSLKAKLILTLAVSPAQAQGLLDRAGERLRSNSEDAKYQLSQADRLDSLQLKIESMTYIPAYSGLEQGFFLEKFGEPVYQEVLSDEAVQWYYPNQGLRIVIDAKGREVLQYAQPGKLFLPPTVELYSSNSSLN